MDVNKVSIKEIARETGFSPATVSLSLNDSDLVKDSTREMIKKTAKALGYSPNPYARKLVLQKSGMLGLIVPTIRNVYYADLVYYINDAVRKLGYGLIIATSDNDSKSEKKIIEEMYQNQVEGIMLAPINVPNEDNHYIDEMPVPLIFTTAKYNNIHRSCVMCDLEKGMYDITSRIVENKHTGIAFVTGYGGINSLDLRETGFKTAVKDKAKFSVFRIGKLGYNGGCEAAENIMNAKENFDTVICVDDMVASGVVNTLISSGYDVPENLWVTGFDDNIFSKTCAVPITTVKQNIQQIAMETVKLILEIIKNKAEAYDITIPCEVILRKSAL